MAAAAHSCIFVSINCHMKLSYLDGITTGPEIVLMSSIECRGYKVVVKLFPNEASNLEPVVSLLLKLKQQVCRVLGTSHVLHPSFP